MKKNLKRILSGLAILLIGASGVMAGSLDPTNAPGPTMHTLEEIYQKLVTLQTEVERLKAPELNLVQPEFVTVGDAGNEDDQGGSGAGAVSYEYRIGKYEVTNDEYVKFLNAVDSTGADAFGLYNTSMNTDARGGISNNVSAVNGAKYVVKLGRENNPVVYVSFYDAMRFCNWLHNGAVVGGDTENGAYTLLGGAATPSNGTTVERNAGAKFAVPTEDEWYKAAYFDPVNAGADAGGNVDYWLYPMQTDSEPYSDQPPGTDSPDSRIAGNFYYNDDVANGYADGYAVTGSTFTDDAQNYLTDVGAYSSASSYYGTFDQGGNVLEWNETRSGSPPILRGGTWDFSVGSLRSDDSGSLTPGNVFGNFGFRISSP